MTIAEAAGSSVTIPLSDTICVKTQDNDIVVNPRAGAFLTTGLKDSTKYTVQVPANHLMYMATAISFDFTTGTADTNKPRILMNCTPTPTTKMTLGALASKVPWLLFSEGAGLSAAANVNVLGTTGNYNSTLSTTCPEEDASCITYRQPLARPLTQPARA